MAEHQIFTAKLAHYTDLSDQTRNLEFQVEGAGRFDFQAGQFVSVKEQRRDGKQITRAYSIASPPRGDGRFELCLNRVDEGFMSNRLCDLAVGQSIHWHGPHGLFTLADPVKDSIFICTGTGVAPFRSMIHHLLAESARNAGHEFWLVYGTRYESDLYYAEEFRKLEKTHRNFHYMPTLSRASKSWKGLQDYVQTHVRNLMAARPAFGAGFTHAYICGLFDMVDANRKVLQELGWDRKDIFYERYD